MMWRIDSNIRAWLPKLQCHRGFWVEGLQQNSLDSIREAQARGYKMAEFDVRLSRDQVVVAIHDEKFQERMVSEMTLSELTGLTTFEQILIWFSQSYINNEAFDFKLNIEIKSKKIFDGRLEKAVNDLIQKYDVADHVLISSFNPFSLFRFRMMNSRIFRALLLTQDHESNFLLNHMLLNILCRPDVLNLRWNDFNEISFKKIIKKVPIVLWTVNEPDILSDKHGNIFGIITDRITPQQFKIYSV